jgi:5-hydroxyisourate hydrolase
MASGMKRISTHILDIALGKPARNVPARLERQEPSGWRVLSQHQTDSDGRCAQLLAEGDSLSPGSYRLVFDVASYFASQEVDALYPVVEVTFQVRDGETQFHMPLLLSSHGYTTYRGS